MQWHPFLMQREGFLHTAQLERIEEATCRILSEIGIAVLDEGLRVQLARRGFPLYGNRVRIPRQLVARFLEAERERNGYKFSEQPQAITSLQCEITLGVSSYPHHVHDLESDAIVPFTTSSLIEATKLVDVLAERGITSSPPGIPCDVAPELGPVLQYWIAATYSRQGRCQYRDAKSVASHAYVMEMAEILGDPVRSLDVWVFSPLTLGGESLACVLAYQNKLTSISVGSMPAVGSTAPIYVGDAYALAAAEVIGSAILLREALGKEMRWHLNIFPADMRSMAMVFGSPENLLFQLATAEVNAFFHGTPWHPAAGNIHSNATLPGSQACAEKASLMTAGALLGARHFGTVGALSLDEVFSAEQLLYDLEIKEHVQRLVAGLDGACDPQRCLDDLREAIMRKSFAGLETTVQEYRSLYWHPALFERQFLGAWEVGGRQTLCQRVHTMVRELLSQHEYALEPELQRELDKVLAQAKSRLGAS